jgi:hypothetical protein
MAPSKVHFLPVAGQDGPFPIGDADHGCTGSMRIGMSGGTGRKAGDARFFCAWMTGRSKRQKPDLSQGRVH